MAKHIITAITQLRIEHVIKANPLIDWPGIQDELDHSSWTENLDIEDYMELQQIVHQKDFLGLVFWLGKTNVKYTSVWKRLDEPETKEKWDEQVQFFAGMHG